MSEVEGAVIDHLQQHVLDDAVLETVLADVRTEIAGQLPKHEADTDALETELSTARSEQRRLAKAVAMTDEVPELLGELRRPTALIQNLEARITAANPPDQFATPTWRH